jgi:hypothetical protein
MSHLSVHKENRQFFSNLPYYVQKQVELLSLLTMNKRIIFLLFLNKYSTVIFLYIFSSALLISLNFPFISVLSFCFSGYLLFH